MCDPRLRSAIPPAGISSCARAFASSCQPLAATPAHDADDRRVVGRRRGRASRAGSDGSVGADTCGQPAGRDRQLLRQGKLHSGARRTTEFTPRAARASLRSIPSTASLARSTRRWSAKAIPVRASTRRCASMGWLSGVDVRRGRATEVAISEPISPSRSSARGTGPLPRGRRAHPCRTGGRVPRQPDPAVAAPHCAELCCAGPWRVRTRQLPDERGDRLQARCARLGFSSRSDRLPAHASLRGLLVVPQHADGFR